MATRNLGDDCVGLQRLLDDTRLLVVRPTPSPAAASDHFDTSHRQRVRLDHKLKSGHKPIPQIQEIRLAHVTRKLKVGSEHRLPLTRVGRRIRYNLAAPLQRHAASLVSGIRAAGARRLGVYFGRLERFATQTGAGPEAGEEITLRSDNAVSDHDHIETKRIGFGPSQSTALCLTCSKNNRRGPLMSEISRIVPG